MISPFDVSVSLSFLSPFGSSIVSQKPWDKIL